MENDTNSHITNLTIEELIGGTRPFDAWLTSSGTCCYMFKLKTSIFEASKCVDDLHEMERKTSKMKTHPLTLPWENVKYISH